MASTKNDSADAVVDFLLHMSSNNINVVTVANSAKGRTLQEFTDFTLQDYARYYSDYSLLSIENTTLAGQPAHKVVWQATVPQKVGNSISNAQVKTMQYLVVHNGKEYVVAYKTVKDDYSTYLTQAQEVIKSFKFTS